MRGFLQNNVYAIFFVALAAMAFVTDAYSQYLINLMLVYVIIAQGLNLILGFAGMFAFAHGAFMAIGAYVSALLATKLGVPYLLALPAAGIAAAAVGCVIGIPAIRVSGLYLAMVTVGFSEIMQWILRHWKPVTGGTDGMSVAAPRIFGVAFRSDIHTFSIILAVAVLMTILAQSIVRSRLGRAFVAIRDGEIAAQSSGIDVARTKVLAFAISAFYAGIGGSLFSLTQHYITPENFNLYQTIMHFCMVIVGGAASLIGPFIGAAVLTWLPEILRNAQALQEIGFGLLLIVFVIFLPRGLAGFLFDRGILPRERFSPLRRPPSGADERRDAEART
ncbi:branched-chain amino acid ABC transporter permease [Aquibium microcysteis]|uniref:branched-chain amino acid ABC transporter permease n=1 Tax=Aquibium microcysteis TaxID=675281 RepID=UPI00165CEE20|nr:branched-chain amino acid ABC transporter permease [Aquibium microcysteis]